MDMSEQSEHPSRSYLIPIPGQPPSSRVPPTISVPHPVRGSSRSANSERRSPVDAPDDRSPMPQPPYSDRNTRGERSQPGLKRTGPNSRGKAQSGSRSEGEIETVAGRPSDLAPDSDPTMRETSSDDDFQLVVSPRAAARARRNRPPPPPGATAEPSQSHSSSGDITKSSAVAAKSLPAPPVHRSRSSSVSSTRAEDGKRPISHGPTDVATVNSKQALEPEIPQEPAPTGILGVVGNMLFGPRQTEEERQREIRRAEEVEEERHADREERRVLRVWQNVLEHHGSYNVAVQFFTWRDEVKELKTAINNLMRRVQHGEHRETALSTALDSAENTVKDLQVELGTSRAFVEADDRGDTSSLISQLTRISSGIDDNSFNIASKILSEHSDEPFTSQMASTLNEMNLWAEYGEDERTIMRNLAGYSVNSENTVEGYAIRACATVLSMGIQRRVFDMFRAGLPQDENDFVLKLYQRIRDEEPQDRAARWRSISFTRALASSPETDDAIASAISTDLLKSVAFLLYPFLLPISSFEDPSLPPPSVEISLERLAPFRAEVTKLVLQAVQWQARTRRDFLSYDYETTVDLATAGANKEGVIGVVGFGLVQIKGVAKDKPARVELVGDMLAEVPWAFPEM